MKDPATRSQDPVWTKNKYESKAKKYIARLTLRDLIPVVCTGICEVVSYSFLFLCIHDGTITESLLAHWYYLGFEECCCR